MAQYDRKRKIDSGIDNKELYNRFRIFYVLRLLWKWENHKVDELYEILKINRTLYGRILGLEKIDLKDRLEQLAQLTEIPAKYWDGYENISLRSWDSQEEDRAWKKLISSRKEHIGNQKTSKQIDIEGVINKNYREALKESNLQYENGYFKRLVYFAKYKEKRPTKTAEELLQQVERDIQRVSRIAVENMLTNPDRLEGHLEIVVKYVERVRATLILQGWDR
ncbi:hypothetical protein [Flavonifractor sp. An306]|uniref:hypothetical protein n=2 Tax=Oscillospiraceae TaxID=216572 RepID=UPI000B3A146C|nr:hypothetical protein [Flavonifractor sp. An306]OUO38277.1 hypothetical protein B5F88_11760 [Flavonifractor sp. An306]